MCPLAGSFEDCSILLVSILFFLLSSTKGDSEILDRRVTRYIILYKMINQRPLKLIKSREKETGLFLKKKKTQRH